MSKKHNIKPKQVDYFAVPKPLWKRIKHHFPDASKRGRPPIPDRVVLNAIWYVLWTGCQWKALKREWFGVSASTAHARMQLWQEMGIFKAILTEMVKFYQKRRKIGWKWQAIDGKNCPAPLGVSRRAATLPTVANAAAKFISWWINVAHLCRSRSRRPIATTNVPWKKWSSRLWWSGLIVSNTFVLTVVMILKMSRIFLNSNTMSPISNIVAAAVSLRLNSVLSQVKRVILLVVGWLNVLLAGLPSGAVFAPVGPRRPPTG